MLASKAELAKPARLPQAAEPSDDSGVRASMLRSNRRACCEATDEYVAEQQRRNKIDIPAHIILITAPQTMCSTSQISEFLPKILAYCDPYLTSRVCIQWRKITFDNVKANENWWICYHELWPQHIYKFAVPTVEEIIVAAADSNISGKTISHMAHLRCGGDKHDPSTGELCTFINADLPTMRLFWIIDGMVVNRKEPDGEGYCYVIEYASRNTKAKFKPTYPLLNDRGFAMTNDISAELIGRIESAKANGKKLPRIIPAEFLHILSRKGRAFCHNEMRIADANTIAGLFSAAPLRDKKLLMVFIADAYRSGRLRREQADSMIPEWGPDVLEVGGFANCAKYIEDVMGRKYPRDQPPRRAYDPDYVYTMIDTNRETVHPSVTSPGLFEPPPYEPPIHRTFIQNPISQFIDKISKVNIII